jgi:hypothetical protein
MEMPHLSFFMVLFLLISMGGMYPVMAENDLNSTDMGNESPVVGISVSPVNAVNETPEPAATAQAPPQYGSLGEIIKAKDWKALGEYKCRIKAENAGKFDDSVAAIEAQESSWTTRFTSPFTVVDSSSCCG